MLRDGCLGRFRGMAFFDLKNLFLAFLLLVKKQFLSLSFVLIMQVGNGSSAYPALFLESNCTGWLSIERLIGEEYKLTLLDVDISFLSHMIVCGEVDLSGDFWPGVSSIENSLVVSYLLVDISGVGGDDVVLFVSSLSTVGMDLMVSSFDVSCCRISSFVVRLSVALGDEVDGRIVEGVSCFVRDEDSWLELL